MVPEVGVDHGEKQRPMALAAGWMGGGGLEPSADSDVSSCALRTSNPGVEMPEVGIEPTRLYRQGIISPVNILLSAIYVNSPQRLTTR